LSGFTTLAETWQPAEVVSMLNCVFERLTRAIFQFDGTLDKFLGDGLLAVFGAPVAQADHAERALSAAILMRQLLEECQLTGSGGEPLTMRIGINSGSVVAGDIGSPLRKDYTIVGDAVNVASRLQSSVAKPGQIVIGQTTYELCKHGFECEPLPEIRLKGKQQTVRPYLVVGQRLDTIG
jgi:adenylate cyclase